MAEYEPEIVIDELPEALPSRREEKAKQRSAGILALGIVFGFLIMVFAITVVVIDLVPGEDKVQNFILYATWGNWVLAVGGLLLEFFLAITASIFIWRRTRKYLRERM